MVKFEGIEKIKSNGIMRYNLDIEIIINNLNIETDTKNEYKHMCNISVSV